MRADKGKLGGMSRDIPLYCAPALAATLLEASHRWVGWILFIRRFRPGFAGGRAVCSTKRQSIRRRRTERNARYGTYVGCGQAMLADMMTREGGSKRTC